MLSNFKSRAVIILLGLVVAAAIFMIAFFTEVQIQKTEDQIIAGKINEVSVLGSRTSLRLSDAATILQIAASSPEFTGSLNLSLLSPNSIGVGQNEEIEKRITAKNIMQHYPNFETIGYLRANGDLYLLEPYEAQKNVTLKNFSFRDYYGGVLNSSKPYLSEVIRSNATGHVISALAVPVLNPGNGSLVGILVGALDLKDISSALKEVGSGTELVSYMDQRGQEVASSDPRVSSLLSNRMNTSSDLMAFNKTKMEEYGSRVEEINGTKYFMAYAPINAISATWTALSMQPYDEVFSSVDSIRVQEIIMLLALVALAAFAAVVLHRSFSSIKRSNDDLIEKEKQLAQANQQLKNQSNVQKDFINVAAHELRTPIVPILNLTELLYSKLSKYNETVESGAEKNTQIRLKDSLKMQEITEVIMRSAYRLHQLTEDILDVTKIETDSLKLRLEDVNLREIIEPLVESYNRDLEEKRIRSGNDIQVTYLDEANGALVKADKGRLTQVLTNLISNSIKFTKNGTINILTKIINSGGSGNKSENRQILVTVKDFGSGIDPEIYPHLFSKFVTKSDQGTGLGLYISKKIIEATGGKIWAENNANEKGSTFYFTLPVSPSGRLPNNE